MSGKPVKTSYPRIRAVTRKSDGRSIRVIGQSEDGRARKSNPIIEDATHLAVQGNGERLHGYVIVTWDSAGYREHAYWWKNGQVISPQMIPQFVAEGIENGLRANGYIDGF